MRSKTKSALGALALFSAAAMMLSACGATDATAPAPASPKASETADGPLGNAAQQKAFDALYQKAKAEGQVVIYGPPQSTATTTAFESRFPGIKVVEQSIQGAERTARLKAEETSGNYAGDIVRDGQTPVVQLANSGQCAVVDPIMDVPEKWLEMDGKVLDGRISIFGMVYNTNMLKKSEVPQTWEELLEPKWKGKITMVNPAAGGAGAFTLAQLIEEKTMGPKYGMPWLTKLKAQDLQLVTRDAQMVQAVATGESPLAIVVFRPLFTEVKDKGAPIEYSFPMKADNMWTLNSSCLLAKAPHPNAAKLYVDWIWSPEGQKVIAAEGSYPVMPGSTPPGGMPPIEEVSLLKKLPLLEALTGYDDDLKQVLAFFK
jgi:iron(III) transport system substrate-binding protein